MESHGRPINAPQPHSATASVRSSKAQTPSTALHILVRATCFLCLKPPIDLMSFLTLYPKNWQDSSYIAMNGVYESAVLTALEEHPNIDCRIEKLRSQLNAAFRNGQYRYLAEYALAGSVFFSQKTASNQDCDRAFSLSKQRLGMLYHPYRDRCRSTVLYRDLSAKIADVMQDLKNYARTEEQTRITADKLYDLADYTMYSIRNRRKMRIWMRTSKKPMTSRCLTIPDKPKSKKQRYYNTQRINSFNEGSLPPVTLRTLRQPSHHAV